MSSAPPPPPPPAPHLPVVNRAEKPEPGGTVIHNVNTTHYMYVGQLGLHEHRQLCQRDRIPEGDREGKVIYLSYYRTVVPIIQNGPLCGLVALAMAATLIEAKGMTTEKLLDTAIQRGFTKQGEMFSASNMCCLVQSLVEKPICSEVVTNCKESQLLQYILQGDLFLIPYDADKNHSPCHKQGHKAHWMLIFGGFFAVNNSEHIIDTLLLEENEDYHERNLFHLKPGSKVTADTLQTLHQNTDKITNVYVYGHQGKSKHTGVWTISELLSSNAQLLELGPERTAEEYIIPADGIQKGLCGQIVRIFHQMTHD